MKNWKKITLIAGIAFITLTFTACPEPDPNPTTYTITFNSNEGSVVSPITGIANGATIEKPTDPTKENNIFSGWYKDNTTFANAWNFATDTVTANITLYAKWITETDTDPWSAWMQTAYPGTEERIYKTDPSRIEHRITGTDRFSFEANSSSSYLVRKGTAISGEVRIPTYYRLDINSNFYPVTEIGSKAFEDCITLTSITIPNTVTSISREAFDYCTGLTSIMIPGNVTSIGIQAFQNCYRLASIIISEGVTSIGTAAFWGCTSTNLTNVTIPTSVTSIGAMAFSDWKVTSIEIPTNVEYVGDGTFRNWTSLQTINIMGHASQAEADMTWNIGTGNWRSSCTAKINYFGDNGGIQQIKYTITFNADNGFTPTTQSVTEGNKVYKPIDPVKNGYTFVGWFNTANDTEWNFNNVVTEDVTLKAKWTVKTYTVTFNSNGGTSVSPVNGVIHGTTISAPTIPTREPGYYDSFIGWYKEASLLNTWNFTTDTVIDNITLYAKWRPRYEIGDTGPSGGKIFYRSEDGFTVVGHEGSFESYIAHYLEVAPGTLTISGSNYSTLFSTKWASAPGDSMLIPGLSQNENDQSDWIIGRGRKNTAIIIAHATNNNYTADAAGICANSVFKNLDWFLPSRYELDELYNQRTLMGVIVTSSGNYWSSSQGFANYAWSRSFSNNISNGNTKSTTNNIRLIRAF